LQNRYGGVQILTFGHAGDGNLHVNCLFQEGPESPLISKVMAEVFEIALNLGGTLSGEHGIGLTKRPFVKRELGDRAVTLMKAIKGVWDEKGILNPGKVF
jgi:glycolate oxidase